MLAAWKFTKLRGRPVWIATIVAEVAILVQVLLGTILVAGDETYRKTVPRFHMFYGFLIFVTDRSALPVPRADEGPPGAALRARRPVHHGPRDPRGAAGGRREAPTRVMVIFGGRSAEHDVSRVTAVAVAGALDPDRYEVVPVAITTDGRLAARR